MSPRSRTFAVAALVLLAGPVVSRAADDVGKRLYTRECFSCHLDAGRGVAAVAPPLRRSLPALAREPRGRSYLARVLEFGVAGPIVVDGVTYDGFMPSFGHLAPAEQAMVLNYLLEIGQGGEPVQPFAASEIEVLVRSRTAPEELSRERRALLAEPPASKPPAAAIPHLHPDAELYARHCQGCHTPEGARVGSLVPPLQGRIGDFLLTARGREYLVRVPGVAYAAVSDDELARLLNWCVTHFAGESLPAGFVPYSAAEVAPLRALPLTAVAQERAAIERDIKRLRRSGSRSGL